MPRAIYKIINTVNGKFYVGSSIDTRRRFWNHKRLLRNGSHHCCHLQSSWNKHGEDAFEFVVIEEIPDDQCLVEAENIWLREHFGHPHCFNTGRRADAPMRGLTGEASPFYGRKADEGKKRRISDTVRGLYNNPDYQPRLGKTHSEESREKISAQIRKAVSEGRAGCFIPSEETRKKMSDALKGNTCALGYKRTDAEKKAISERMKGKQLFLGKKHSDETRAKMGKEIIEMTSGKRFPVMHDAAKEYGMPNLATILRSIKERKPVTKGPNAGLQFAYIDDIPDVVETEYPRTRVEAKASGSKYYFTGEPCKRGHVAKRLTKGTCTECMKEDLRADAEKRKGQPRTEAAKQAARRYYEKNRERILAKSKKNIST